MAIKRLFAALSAVFCAAISAGAFTLTDGRDCRSLGGQWNYIPDPMDTGIYKYQMTLQKPHARYFADRHFFQEVNSKIEYDFDAAPTLQVPGDWNSQSERLYYYEGGITRDVLLVSVPEIFIKDYRIRFDGASIDVEIFPDGGSAPVTVEIPCYWNIDWTSEETYANAEKQLTEMIDRDRNRAATIIWSVANETPRKPERLSFLRRLIEKARAEDPTRLVSAAMEKRWAEKNHAVVEDDLISLTDIISFNQYEGWYDGLPADCDSVKWTIPAGKPVFISEFGGGARYGIQDEFNRKGLVDEQGRRKQAFHVLKDFYSAH